MRNIILISGVIALLASCNGVDEKTQLLNKEKELVSELEKLETELDSVRSELDAIDPSRVEVKKELVTVIPIEKSEYNHFLEVQAQSSAEDNVMVTTDLGGLVKAVYVDEGQYVSKGKTLIQLDNSIAMNQKAELETAASLAKDVYDKRKRLWDQNIGSEIEYLQAKNNYESLQDKLATANTQLYKASIKAPISGYVDRINLNVGEMASPGAPAVQVVNTNNMEVHVSLPEIYLGQVQRGDDILAEFPALGLTKNAKVKSVGQTINQNNRTFNVIASVENKDGSIKPNLLAKIKINDESIPDAITIPTRLLQESSNSNFFVFVAEPTPSGTDSTKTELIAKRVNIKTGSSYGDRLVVTSGLDAGVLLIDAGYRKVREGMPIIISDNSNAL